MTGCDNRKEIVEETRMKSIKITLMGIAIILFGISAALLSGLSGTPTFGNGIYEPHSGALGVRARACAQGVMFPCATSFSP